MNPPPTHNEELPQVQAAPLLRRTPRSLPNPPFFPLAGSPQLPSTPRDPLSSTHPRQGGPGGLPPLHPPGLRRGAGGSLGCLSGWGAGEPPPPAPTRRSRAQAPYVRLGSRPAPPPTCGRACRARLGSAPAPFNPPPYPVAEPRQRGKAHERPPWGGRLSVREMAAVAEAGSVPGLQADCEELLGAFQEADTVRFERFAELWRERRFHTIFQWVGDGGSRPPMPPVLRSATAGLPPGCWGGSRGSLREGSREGFGR